MNRSALNISASKAFDAYRGWAISVSNERFYYYSKWLKSTGKSFDKNPLLIALPFSLLFHGFLFYFAIPSLTNKPTSIKSSKTFEITLLNIKSEKNAPEKVDLIAQVNTEASGSGDKKARPMSIKTTASQLSAIEKEMALAMKLSPKKAEVKKPKIITTQKDSFVVASFNPNTNNKKKIEKEKHIQQKPVKSTVSEVDAILAQIEKLEVEIGRNSTHTSKKPRTRYLDTLATKSADEAEYLVKWAKQVELIGTLYFPKMAVKKGLSGVLILQVVLNHQGKIVSTEIQMTSGHEILDKGALEIIKLASPFPPLPKVISEKWELLSITRAWHFKSGVVTPVYTSDM